MGKRDLYYSCYKFFHYYRKKHSTWQPEWEIETGATSNISTVENNNDSNRLTDTISTSTKLSPKGRPNMELSKKLLVELQNRLKIGNRRGVHLNAIPALSKYKFDISRFSYIDEDLPNKFIASILTELPLKFKISWKNNVDLNLLFKDDQAELVMITKSLENLIYQTETIESEKGINTFGFGFPLLVRKDQVDNKLTVAPILIWSLRINRTKEFNTWIVQRDEDDPIYVNEILINHLYNDSQVVIDQLPSEMLEDGLIDKETLLDICVKIVECINSSTPDNIRETFRTKLDNINPIQDKKYYEKLPLTSSNSLIEFAGLFSIFEVQKQNIINDYDELIKLKGSSIDLEELEDHSFQSISSVETDPSQQNILNCLGTCRNILIQGPPGTGKSQSLTAILINALENHKKTIVVCEKRTALEVLYNALKERGLGDHFILIKDPIKDRRTVVDSVRNRIDKSSSNILIEEVSKERLNIIINRSQNLINSINIKHKKLDKKIIGSNNWTSIVGKFLSELKSNNEDYNLEFDESIFDFDSVEFEEISNILQTGQKLYEIYKPFESFSFLNPDKLIGDNQFALEQKIKEDFKLYSEELRGKNSPIKAILEKNKDVPDFFNYQKTNSLIYKLSSLFSKSKREVLTDQKILSKSSNNLREKIKNDNWTIKSVDDYDIKKFIQSIELLLHLENAYFNNENELFSLEFSWFQFYNRLTNKDKTIIDNLKNKVNWTNLFRLFYFNLLLTKIASSDLPRNDEEHNELGKSLSYIGKEQIKYINRYWLLEQIKAKYGFESQNKNLSVENLYNKRGSHKHKRLTLRNIVNYDVNLFTTFFPIILTIPDVCCNLFKGKNKYFDIVLFDEASQLRLEDNLPALLKAKQVIVAGDEHQMPPSNYFNKIFDGSIDDEDEIEDESEDLTINRDDILSSCESLLDFATELSFKKRYLDFHYRSRHPYLIDFSNHAFYYKRLSPLPNNFEYTPIKFIQINGTYSDHGNEREAEAVLSIIENNINKLPNGKYPSVGIATFNIAQRNLIKNKILERQKFERFDKFNKKIIELEENGLFIKNLENIQGDERDVIILSTTFGISKDGKFAHRFGPLNHKKGYRLLNVIITRAKYKIYVCSSIPEKVFLNYKDYLATEGANNRRAVFFAYLAYAKAVSENDLSLRQSVLNVLSENSTESTNIDILNSDLESCFEEEVYQVLIDNFSKEKILPQFQFAGFRIDIVYDSKMKGVPKVAIECDGAAFHSSQEAYLYDYHRQKILEQNGFVFHRIWSTNWWRNPKRETKNLIDFINKVESQQKTSSKSGNEVTRAFTDDISQILKNPVPNYEEDRIDIEGYFNTGDSVILKEAKYINIVLKNSRVKIKYINDDEKLIIRLVDSILKNSDQSDGIKMLENNSPLAVSIMGKAVGDTVKIGNLDNYVEILEIVN